MPDMLIGYSIEKEVIALPRPTKCRRVCRFPETLEFCPQNAEKREQVVLTVDEFEVIRLIDKERLSQEECSKRLGVARTTAQKIYETARRKLADVLVDGLPLKIEGGDYRLCDGWDSSCPKHDCCKKQIAQIYKKEKGENMMRIAVTYENGEIFQHFGHTEQFKVYDVEKDEIVSSQVFDTNGSGHGALGGVLQALKVDILICGGIGGGAQRALAEAGIKLYGGASGGADDAVRALLGGTLNFNPNVHCNHHGHGDGEGHTCGSNGCGEHHCGNS